MENKIEQMPEISRRYDMLFSRLQERDIEHFYAQYQLWVLYRRLPILENQAVTLREHIAENHLLIQLLRPSALTQAVLARLQSKGVRDRELLDQMLERGEEWLDHMMQRLDYCEEVEDFIQGDYTQWCVNSLEGAYDWIDSLRGSPQTETTFPLEGNALDDPEAQATAELLLQKLKTDDEETMREVTLKSPASQPESISPSEDLASEATTRTEVEQFTALTTNRPALDTEAASEIEVQQALELPTSQVEIEQTTALATDLHALETEIASEIEIRQALELPASESTVESETAAVLLASMTDGEKMEFQDEPEMPQEALAESRDAENELSKTSTSSSETTLQVESASEEKETIVPAGEENADQPAENEEISPFDNETMQVPGTLPAVGAPLARQAKAATEPPVDEGEVKYTGKVLVGRVEERDQESMPVPTRLEEVLSLKIEQTSQASQKEGIGQPDQLKKRGFWARLFGSRLSTSKA